jgi:hypothetical protein
VALIAGAAGVIVAVDLLSSQPGPVGSAAPLPPSTSTSTSTAPATEGGRIPTPTSPGYPSPPPGAVVFAREAGTSALALAVVPGGARPLTRVSVVDGQGAGRTRLEVSVAGTAFAPCGAGCYQGHVPTRRLEGTVLVSIGGRKYGFRLPPSLDLRSGAATMARASRVWRELKTLVWHERLAATPTDALYTVYRAVAPDQLSYTISRRSSALIIGTKRWDRPSPNAPWVESPQLPPIRQPEPFWASVSDARVVGEGTVDGKPVSVVTFFDPATPAWFEARVERSTGRTLVLDMIAAAHFMHHVYGPFDAPFELRPPPSA